MTIAVPAACARSAPPAARFAPPKKQGKGHAHFGAGRLGLGLVIPAIAENDPNFVVLQRRSREWLELSGSDRAEVSVNGRTELCLSVAPDLARASPAGTGSLILSDSAEVWAEAAERAGTMSCSMGPSCAGVLIPVLGRLPLRDSADRPVLYACENDAEAVGELASALRGRVDVNMCMVDRICYSKTVGAGRIDVSAERHRGSIVVYDPDGDDQLPMDGGLVTVTDDPEVARYLFAEKKCLVNGIHAALAFRTLILHEERHGPRPPCAGLPILRSACRGDRVIRSWAAASVCWLLDEWGEDVLFRARGEPPAAALASKAAESLGRFSAAEDTTSRVLRRGLAASYADRMAAVVGWARARRQRGWSEAQARLARSMSAEPEELEEDVESLARGCERLVASSV